MKINTSGVLCHYPIELALAEKSRQEVHLGNKQVREILGIQTVLNLPLYSIDEIFHTKDCQMLRKDNLIGSKETFIDYQLKRNMNERYISSTIHVDVTDYMSDNVTSYQSHMLMFKEGQKSFISHMEEKHRSIKRE